MNKMNKILLIGLLIAGFIHLSLSRACTSGKLQCGENCYANCQTCGGEHNERCIACIEGYFRRSDQCVATCTNPVNANYHCLTCKTGENKNKCQSCQVGYRFNSDNEYCTRCATDYNRFKGSCIKCGDNQVFDETAVTGCRDVNTCMTNPLQGCATCSTTNNQICATCANNYNFLTDSTCVKCDASAGKYFKANVGCVDQCLVSDAQHCATCGSTNKAVCATCQDNYNFLTGTCIQCDASAGKYFKANVGCVDQCLVNDAQHCATCDLTNKAVCATCQDNYNFLTGTCIQCDASAGKYFKANVGCVDQCLVNDAQHCATCGSTNKAICATCQDNYNFLAGTCIQCDASAGLYFKENVGCVKLCMLDDAQHCATCDSDDESLCGSCLGTYNFNAGQCCGCTVKADQEPWAIFCSLDTTCDVYDGCQTYSTYCDWTVSAPAPTCDCQVRSDAIPWAEFCRLETSCNDFDGCSVYSAYCDWNGDVPAPSCDCQVRSDSLPWAQFCNLETSCNDFDGCSVYSAYCDWNGYIPDASSCLCLSKPGFEPWNAYCQVACSQTTAANQELTCKAAAAAPYCFWNAG